MKKCLLLLSFVIYSFACVAQDDVGEFFSNIVEDAVAPDSTADQSLHRKAFTAKKTDTVKVEEKKEVQPKAEDNQEAPVKQKAVFVKNKDIAPFGLLWGESVQSTETLGVDLAPLSDNENSNIYEATNLPKQIRELSVTVDFGDTDQLWRIVATSTPEEDDAKGSKLSVLYKKYTQLLEKKYGKAENSNKNIEYIKPGEDNYLKDINNKIAHTSLLYTSETVNIKISGKVVDENKTYMEIEYVSTKMLQAKEDTALDAL